MIKAFYNIQIKIHINYFSRLEQHFEIDRFVHQLDGQKYVDIKRFDKDTSMVLLVRFSAIAGLKLSLQQNLNISKFSSICSDHK